ncbi:3',5'-cyclic-nucleotide phosphodiesterase regA [Pelomyxa schiedti]|nr:3',5'-cyclic-nucleotide phosphodiesterase regA [Pelomyxa schiedti]
MSKPPSFAYSCKNDEEANGSPPIIPLQPIPLSCPGSSHHSSSHNYAPNDDQEEADYERGPHPVSVPITRSSSYSTSYNFQNGNNASNSDPNSNENAGDEHYGALASITKKCGRGGIKAALAKVYYSPRVRFSLLVLLLVAITCVSVSVLWYERSFSALGELDDQLIQVKTDAIFNIVYDVTEKLNDGISFLELQARLNPALLQPETANDIWSDMISSASVSKLHLLMQFVPEDPYTFDPSSCDYVTPEYCNMTQTSVSDSGDYFSMLMRSKFANDGKMCGYYTDVVTCTLRPAYCLSGLPLYWGSWLTPVVPTGELFNDTRLMFTGTAMNYFVTLARVLFSTNSTPLAWFIVGMSIPKINVVLNEIPLASNEFAYILDSTGHLIAAMGNFSIPDTSFGAIYPADCGDERIIDTYNILLQQVTDILGIEEPITSEYGSRHIQAAPFTMFHDVRWIVVIITENSNAYLNSVSQISTFISLGVIGVLLVISVLSSISLSKSQKGIRPAQINLDSGMMKVIEKLRALNQTLMSNAAHKTVDSIIEMLECTEGLFKPDFKEQSSLLDSDVQKWLDCEIIPNGITSHSAQFVRASPAIPDSLAMEQLQEPELLANIDCWDYMVDHKFLSKEYVLTKVASQVLLKLSVFDHVSVKLGQVESLFQDVESLYKDNPYHNSHHATDVVQCIYYILTHGLIPLLGPTPYLEIFSLICAAVMHDVGHPGVNNAFLTATSDPIAIQFNDRSVLENLHSSIGVKLLLQHAKQWSLAEADLKFVRSTLIEMILGTDISHHFEILSKFQTVLEGGKFDPTQNLDHRLQIMSVTLKLADISNCMRPRKNMLFWVSRLVEEFFGQGDQEAALNLPLSPFTDRKNGLSKLPKLQANFISLIAQPLLSTYTKVVPCPEIQSNLQANMEFWASNPIFHDTWLSSGIP